MKETSDCEHLVGIVNQAINEKEIDGELVVSSIKKLRLLNPELALSFSVKERSELRVKCQGYCLENKVGEEFSCSLMVTIGEHAEHAYCQSCFSSWIFSRFYENPLEKIYCQRCVLNNQSNPVEIPADYIQKHIIPSNSMSSYTSFYMEKNYKKCIVCTNYFLPNSIFVFECGHSYCPKDLVGFNLEYYNNLLIKNKEYIQDSIVFKIACKCGKLLDIDIALVQVFSQYMESLNHFFAEKHFYSKFRKFFSLQCNAKWKHCCKKYKLDNNQKECLHCGKCLVMDHPIHSGYSCEDFLNLPNNYEIDFDSPAYHKHTQVSNLNPLLLKSISIIKKVFRIHNKYMEVATRYKHVWEFGFLFFNDLTQVQEHLTSQAQEEIRVFPSLDERFDHKFAVLCELNGTEIVRNSDFHPTSEDLIFITSSEIRAAHKRQVRYLNLIILA